MTKLHAAHDKQFLGGYLRRVCRTQNIIMVSCSPVQGWLFGSTGGCVFVGRDENPMLSPLLPPFPACTDRVTHPSLCFSAAGWRSLRPRYTRRRRSRSGCCWPLLPCCRLPCRSLGLWVQQVTPRLGCLVVSGRFLARCWVRVLYMSTCGLSRECATPATPCTATFAGASLEQ